MSLSIGDRVRVNVKSSAQYPAEMFYNGLVGTVVDHTANPWFPVKVTFCRPKEGGITAYFRESECELAEGGGEKV